MARLISSRSVAASMTSSHVASGAASPIGVIRPSAASASLAASLPPSTARCNRLAMPALPFSAVARSEIAQQHGKARLRSHLRDARAHLSRTDHADGLHFLALGPCEPYLNLRNCIMTGAMTRLVSRFLLVAALLASSPAAAAQGSAPGNAAPSGPARDGRLCPCPACPRWGACGSSTIGASAATIASRAAPSRCSPDGAGEVYPC